MGYEYLILEITIGWMRIGLVPEWAISYPHYPCPRCSLDVRCTIRRTIEPISSYLICKCGEEKKIHGEGVALSTQCLTRIVYPKRPNSPKNTNTQLIISSIVSPVIISKCYLLLHYILAHSKITQYRDCRFPLFLPILSICISHSLTEGKSSGHLRGAILWRTTLLQCNANLQWELTSDVRWRARVSIFYHRPVRNLTGIGRERHCLLHDLVRWSADEGVPCKVRKIERNIKF